MNKKFYTYFPGKFNTFNIPIGVPWHMMFLTGWTWNETHDEELDWSPEQFQYAILKRKKEWEALNIIQPKPLISIDREHWFMKVLHHVDHPQYKEAIQTACDMLKFAKKVWPEAQWSMYGIPTRQLYRYDGRWWKNPLSYNETIKRQVREWSDIWEASDWFGPSFYLPFDSNGNTILPKLAIEVVHKWEDIIGISKPIYPWVTHRSTRSYNGWRLFTPEEMETHIGKNILDIAPDNPHHIHTVDGFLWWYRARSNLENPVRGRPMIPCDPGMPCYPYEEHLEGVENYIYDNLFEITNNRGIKLVAPKYKKKTCIRRLRNGYRAFKN